MTLTHRDLEQLAAQGESETLELKRSTVLLPRAGETLGSRVGSRPRRLSGTHKSVPPDLHSSGSVKGFSNERVSQSRLFEECQRYGIEPPIFEAEAGFVVVTFRAQIGPAAVKAPHAGTKSAPSRDQVQVLEFAREPRSVAEFMQLLGRTDGTKLRDQVLRPLLEGGLIEMTCPKKPAARCSAVAPRLPARNSLARTSRDSHWYERKMPCE